MPRKKKDKLCFKKNEKRKKIMKKCSKKPNALNSLRVSVPSTKIYLSSMKAKDINHLYSAMTTLKLIEDASMPWFLTKEGNETTLFCHKIQCSSPQCSSTVLMTVVIDSSFKWTLSCKGHLVDKSCPALISQPELLQTPKDVANILTVLSRHTICIGNNDERFVQLLNERKGVIKERSGDNVNAYLDQPPLEIPTVRHINCHIIVKEADSRCPACVRHRKSLRAIDSRKDASTTSKVDPTSHVNYRYLTTNEMQTRLKLLHQSNQRMARQLMDAKKKLEKAISDKSVILNSNLTEDLLNIMQLHSTRVMSENAPHSFRHVFWDQQLKAAVKDPRGMRWHPLMIRWCIYLHHKSSGAYDLLRKSGIVTLPSARTLRDYTHYISPQAGFSKEVDEMLMEAAKATGEEQWKKMVILILDEMYIKEELVYNKQTGELVGFANLGAFNQQLIEFEHSVTSESAAHKQDPAELQLPLAKTMLVMMVRGLLTGLQFPFVQIPCCNLTGEQMYNPFWEAVMHIENAGLKVLATTCDGASVNRRFMKLHNIENSTITYKVPNIYATNEKRYIYFISDPPHLIKTVRNCWASKQRNLWINGKSISWKHLYDLYRRDLSAGKGLRIVPKLKYEHLHLTSFSKMRVDLAAQVLSETVSKALRFTGGMGNETEETARFVAMFDKFFDCLNVSNFFNGIHKRKTFQHPYRDQNDFRLKWLKEEFLPYLDEWEKSVQSVEGVSDTEKKRMIISAETLLGIRITVNSFVELVRYLFEIPGVNFFLSERICQDPLERFFGCQRQRGGTHDNPNALEFYRNTQALRVVNSFCRPSINGNCRQDRDKGDHDLYDENAPPLKKRSKQVNSQPSN